MYEPYPEIDIKATGLNILNLLKERGISIRTLQENLGFTDVRAIYKWAEGRSLPSLDNLVGLSVILRVPMDDILVLKPCPKESLWVKQ